MKSKILNSSARFSQRQIAIFALVFAIIGGYFIWHSFAATAYYVSPSGSDSNNCSQASPCASFARACSVAAGGDTVMVGAGNYGGQTITRSSCNPSSMVTFQANGVVKLNDQNLILGVKNGSPSAANNSPNNLTFDGINIDNGYFWIQYSAGSPASNLVFKNAHVWCTNGCGGEHLLQISSVDGFTASNVELGPQCCNSDAVELWVPNTGNPSPNNVTLDGLNIHDVYDTCNNMPTGLKTTYGCSGTGYGDDPSGSWDHVDGIQGFGCTNCTLKNSRIYAINPSSTVAGQSIFYYPSNGGVYSNLTFQNNMIAPGRGTNTFSLAGGQAESSSYSGYIKFLYNTVLGNGIQIYDYVLAPGAQVIYAGNIMKGAGFIHPSTFSNSCSFITGGSGSLTPIFKNNLWPSQSCDPSDKQGSPTFVNDSNLFAPDLHLANSSQTAVNGGESTYCPATDIDGQARPAGSACDVGADEVGGSAICDATANAGSGTAQTLINSLSSGQTGCLHAGTYTAGSGASYVLDFNKANITIRSYPGELAAISGLVLDRENGPNGHLTVVKVVGSASASNTIQVLADDFTFDNSEVTNNNLGRSCIIIGTSPWTPARTIIKRNYIHGCGANGNQDHGIYDALSTSAQITENVIYDVSGYAIQFYPNAQSTSFTHNVIDGGGTSAAGGVIFAGDSSTSSNNNTVDNNIVTYANRYNIEYFWGGPTGTGNLARFNCVFGGVLGDIISPQVGFTSTSNTVANPSFVNRAGHDYRLNGGSPCLSVVGYDTAALLPQPPPGSTGDSTPPTVSLTAPSNGASVSGSSVSVTASASDNVGVAGVQFKLDGANLGAEDTSAPYSTSWNSTTVLNGTHTLTAVARDAAGNTTTASSITITTSNGASGCLAGNTSWQNQAIATQTSTFTADFDATPNSNNIDSVAGFSSGAAAAYTDLATIVRFNTSGTIDARNGGTYASDASVGYTSGTSYHFKLVINPVAHTYTTYVTPNGSSQILLGNNYAFRTEQAGTSSLNNFAVIGDTGSHTTCAFAISAGGGDTTPPTVSVTTPAGGASLRGSSVAVNANASDNVGVTSVQFKLDGNNLGSADTTSPYGVTWNTTTSTNGTHTLTAVAADAAGNSSTSSSVSVTVDNSPPTVSLTAPTNGSGIKGSAVNVSASASDNFGVAGVQFKLDGSNLGAEDTGSPFSVSWDTTGATNGSHSLTAVARDAAGNTTTSTTVTVTVDNSAPSVSMTAPANGATVSGSSVTVSATASDNIAVAGVQFKLDGSSQGAEDITSPYSISWNTTTLANGTHTLTAVARDPAGNTTTATSITVTVNNVSPPPPDTTPPTVPANLRSTGSTMNSISLAWNASTDSGGSGLGGYNIYRNGSYLTTTSLLTYNDTNLTAGTTYAYRVSAIDNAGNESNQSSALSVDTLDNAPIVSITANPDTINSGQTSSLSWSSINATTCAASGDWSGAKDISGTQSTGALTTSKTYTITCTGPGGSAVDSASVTVIGAPPPPPPPPQACGPKGDIDCDGDVDLKDLSMLLSRYGSNDSTANLDGRGGVDITDLSILLSNYGKKR